MKITIDSNSGFCFGVVYAIQVAEDELDKSGELYCLGDIVHNNMEVDRLRKKGLKIIDHEKLKQLHNCKVLIRAHGEPPETYKIAAENDIELVDASCPVVLKLQNRVRTGFTDTENTDGQIVIYGKEGHAEVNGLVGQTEGKAIIIMTVEDLDKLDYSKPIQLYSQTTKSTQGFKKIKEEIERRIELNGKEDVKFDANDTLCRQVSNREPRLTEFSKTQDVIIFVSGKKSSNGLILHDVCKKNNPNTYMVSSQEDLEPIWFKNVETVGICGATSSPMWLMEAVADKIKTFKNLKI